MCLGLAGCDLGVSVPPRMQVSNRYAQAVTVVVVGPESVRMSFDAADSEPFPLDECTGEAVEVLLEDGTVLGRLEGPACPGTLLTVEADGGLRLDE